MTAETPARLGMPLSQQELWVLRGIADGLGNAAIGRRLHITENTVKTHVRRLYRKLGAKDRASAVAVAYRTGLLTDVPRPDPPPTPDPPPEPITVVVPRTDPRVWRLAEAVRRWERRYDGAVLPDCARLLHHLVTEALKET